MNFWQLLTKNTQEAVRSKSQTDSLLKGTFLYRQEEKPKAAYIVSAGLIGLTATTHKGHEHLLRLFEPGQVLGHRSLVSGESYHANAVCLESTEVMVLSHDLFYELVEGQPGFVWAICQVLARELGVAERRRMLITDEDVLTRAAQALVYLHEMDSSHQWTRQQIADFLASTTATVIRSLGKLEKRGLIRQVGRQIEIIDREGLLNLSRSGESE